jgi:hypothetical protein
MKKLEIFTARPKDTINSYDLLCTYAWVDDFLKSREIQKQISMLERELKRLEALPISKACFRDRLKTGFEQIQKSRIEWLRKFLEENLDASEPLSYYAKRLANPVMGQRFPRFVTWDEIEKALSLIPEGKGALSGQEKENKLLKVEQDLAELKTKLVKLSPDVFFLKRDGRIFADLREELVQTWWALQNRMSEPCSPFGQTLKHSSRAEQAAWEKLLISQAMNPYARLLPDPGNK